MPSLPYFFYGSYGVLSGLTSRFWDLGGLGVRPFSLPHGSNLQASAGQSQLVPYRSGAGATGEWCSHPHRALASLCETPGRRSSYANQRTKERAADLRNLIVANDLEVFRPICDAPEEVVAHAMSIFLVLAVDQIHSGQRRGKAHWISSERRAVGARPPAHHAFSRDDRAKGHAAGNTLRGTKNVRFDSGMFTGPPLPRSSHARLHFVHDEHDSVLAADAL